MQLVLEQKLQKMVVGLKFCQGKAQLVAVMGCVFLAGALHGLQVGQIAAPHSRRGLRLAAGAGKKGGVDQRIAVIDGKPVRGVYGGLCPGPVGGGDGVRVLPALAAAGGGAERRSVMASVGVAAQGIGAAGGGLGP